MVGPLPEVRATDDEVSIRWPGQQGFTVIDRRDRIRHPYVEPPFSVLLEAPKGADS